MRSFNQHKLMVEFVEYLFEFNVKKRAPGSIATWGANKFKDLPGWVIDGFNQAGIQLTSDTVFEITGVVPDAKEIGVGDEAFVYTIVYNRPPADGGSNQGVVVWKQNPSSYFKELKVGNSIEWGRNTDALETAQCLGVYLSNVDTILKDLKDPAKARATHTPTIKSILSSGKDWDSGGVSTLLKKMDNMPDGNWTEMILLAKGMQNFVTKYGKNLGGTLHIIHGSIKKYYDAEESHQSVEGVKENTADMILANSDASTVIDAVKNKAITYHKSLKYCHTDDSSQSVKFYQVSLKKGHDNAQLGKLTGFLKQAYNLPDSVELYKSLVQSYIINHGYELNELNEGWFSDKLSAGLNAIKNFAVSVWEKVKEVALKIKKMASKFISGYEKELPKGKPNNYQINLIQQVLREDGKLGKGQFLTEGRVTKESINTYLKDTSPAGAQKILRVVNQDIKDIDKMFGKHSHLVQRLEKYVPEGAYSKNWTKNEIIKLFANATALNAFKEIVWTNRAAADALASDMIQMEKEIYFGKTKLPLFKVYGASSASDNNTVTDLGTQADYVSGKTERIKDGGYQWPVVGFGATNQGKYYNLEGHLLSDVQGNEPEYTQCRMGTNKADAFSFVFEGTLILPWDKFKKKYDWKP